MWRVDFFLWRGEFFRIGKRDFTFIREWRVHVESIWELEKSLNLWQEYDPVSRFVIDPIAMTCCNQL